MIFTKDLIDTEYHWNTNPAFSALPLSASFVNRLNDRDIVRMITLLNRLVISLGITEGQKTEQMLAKEILLQINDEISVFIRLIINAYKTVICSCYSNECG